MALRDHLSYKWPTLRRSKWVRQDQLPPSVLQLRIGLPSCKKLPCRAPSRSPEPSSGEPPCFIRWNCRDLAAGEETVGGSSFLLKKLYTRTVVIFYIFVIIILSISFFFYLQLISPLRVHGVCALGCPYTDVHTADYVDPKGSLILPPCTAHHANASFSLVEPTNCCQRHLFRRGHTWCPLSICLKKYQFMLKL